MEGQSVENNAEESVSTKPVVKIHSPKLGNLFGVKETFNSMSKPRAAILRPSQLGSVANDASSNNKPVLQTPKFNNPFTKITDNSIVEDTNSEEQKDVKNETKESKSPEKQKDTEEIVPKFLPLCGNTKDNENNLNNTVEPSASTPTFIFGQNLKERVTVSSDTESHTDSSEKEECKVEESNENGSSELLFSKAAAVCRTSSRPGLTLTQAAQEMEEASRANKRKYNEVTLLTGEEGETNVLQINCKLFAFDKASSSWQERGRGTLRLNDRDEESRLVSRTAGTQRLILNTKVWPGMTSERASPKSLRLTAMDVHGDIRIFIVQAAPKEIEQLDSLLTQRIKRAQERQPKKLATEQH